MFLHSHLCLSFLPKPAPGSLETQRPFCGSFSFGFSQGRGQAGLQHLSASLVLKLKPGTPEWNLHHPHRPQGLVEVPEWSRVCRWQGTMCAPFLGPLHTRCPLQGAWTFGRAWNSRYHKAPSSHLAASTPHNRGNRTDPLKRLKPIVHIHPFLPCSFTFSHPHLLLSHPPWFNLATKPSLCEEGDSPAPVLSLGVILCSLISSYPGFPALLLPTPDPAVPAQLWHGLGVTQGCWQSSSQLPVIS